MIKGIVLWSALLLSGQAVGAIDPFVFDDPRQERRYRVLIDELRCVVCQGQAISGSNASLANDLRKKVHDQIKAGWSDDRIRQYMVDRYGDFVLFRPPVQRNTLVLWIGPFAFFGVGLLVWALIVRRRRVALPEASTLSESDRARAKQWLEDAE